MNEEAFKKIFETVLVEKLDEKLEPIKAELKDLSKKFNDLSKKFNDLSANFDAFKGDVNERLLREKVVKAYGEKFSRRFCVQGISGLVRLLIPARKDNDLYHSRDMKYSFSSSDKYGRAKEPSDLQLQQEGIEAIVTHIHKEKAIYKGLRLLLEKIASPSCSINIEDIVTRATTIKLFSSANNSVEDKDRTKELSALLDPIVDQAPTESDFRHLLEYFVKFVKLQKGDQAKELVSDSGIGLLLFCCLFDDIEFPILDLEFDCRGEVDQYKADDNIMFTILAGEIKSSWTGISKAKTQLRKRLYVMKKGLQLMPHFRKLCIDANGREPVIVSRGIVFLPINESKCLENKPVADDYSLELEFC